MSDQLLLKHGDGFQLGSQEQLSFILPIGCALIWAEFKSHSAAWVVQVSNESISNIFTSILESEKTTHFGSIQFIKYLVALEPGPQFLIQQKKIETLFEDELSKRKIKLNGKLLRSGSITGVLDFVGKRLKIEKKIKLMIVDDSKTIRDLLSSIFSKDSEIEIVAVVDHPHKAQKLIAELKPDVITLDIHMPDMNGVDLLKSYLPKFPIPTVMISSITMEEGPLVLSALEMGAVDYIQKPSFSEISHVAPLMIEKVKEASRSKVKLNVYQTQTHKKSNFIGNLDSKSLILIGSSTGGTEALKQVFLSLPNEIPPVLVVQHIPPVFSKAFADRMNQICPFEVREAKDGDLIQANQILIAPGGFQMEIVGSGNHLNVKITDSPPMNRHKPSVDFLFHSAVKFAKTSQISAAVLTGMGADGALGLKALRDQGAKTIAQNEATCVVFGMPKEAIKHGGAELVLPLEEIGLKLMQLCEKRAKAA